MKSKKLSNYLPQKEPKFEIELIQAKIPKVLKQQAKVILKAKRLTWDDLIIASLNKFIDENT